MFEGYETGRREVYTPAHVTPLDFAAGQAWRCEGQPRWSWTLVPAMRKVFVRWKGVTGNRLSLSRMMTRGFALNANAKELCKAAGSIYNKLWNSSYTVGNKRRRIGADLTRLRYAELDTAERSLVHSVSYIGCQMVGTQLARRANVTLV